MARKITRDEAIRKAMELIRRIYGNLAGLHPTGDTRFGRINWIVVLEGGVPICRRFIIYVNATTGDIIKGVKEEKCKS